MFTKNILVVDDDPSILHLLRLKLESANYRVTTALREEEAIAAVQGQVFGLSIVDLKLVPGDGISLMEDLHLITPEMPVIILTAHGSIESAVEAIKKGAFSYLTKPFDLRNLFSQIEGALEKRRLASQVERLRGLFKERHDFANIVANSEEMERVLQVVPRIAWTESTVYIYGESGTGKELIAKEIHLLSQRKNKPFVAINCAALPETLLESELFGHEKGAFTGAVRSKKGLFSQAHEGTIFLDEIGEMPLSIQAKFLRVLQDGQFYPVGGEKPLRADFRVVVATQKDLADQVQQGLFREDLFYRIHVIPIHLPPLRERKEDIPALVEYFLKKFNKKMKKEIRGLTPAARQRLMLHEWPGNVRELENTIEYAVAMTEEDVIAEDFIVQKKTPLTPGPIKTLREARETFEKGYLIHLLELCEGNVTKAAKLAGRYRADFYNLVKKHALKIANFKKKRRDE